MTADLNRAVLDSAALGCVELDRAAVELALEEVRPHLHGYIELLDVDGPDVRVRMSGRCADCTMQQHTLRIGVEQVLRARVPGLRSVVAV